MAFGTGHSDRGSLPMCDDDDPMPVRGQCCDCDLDDYYRHAGIVESGVPPSDEWRTARARQWRQPAGRAIAAFVAIVFAVATRSRK
jgi:hypothetical protein